MEGFKIFHWGGARDWDSKKSTGIGLVDHRIKLFPYMKPIVSEAVHPYLCLDAITVSPLGMKQTTINYELMNE